MQPAAGYKPRHCLGGGWVTAKPLWWHSAIVVVAGSCYLLSVQVQGLAMVTRVWPPLPLAQSRAAETATLTLSREGAPPATTALNIRSTKTELLFVSLPPLCLPPSTSPDTRQPVEGYHSQYEVLLRTERTRDCCSAHWKWFNKTLQQTLTRWW